MSAPTKLIYTIEPESSVDCWVRLEIDILKMTPAIAAEVNSFWANKALILDLAGGDATRAVALRAASQFLFSLFGNASIARAQKDFDDDENEGWPKDHGITLLDFEVPCLFAESLQIVTEEADEH